MNIVVDSSVLVGEVLRSRGLALLAHPELTLFQPDHAASETAHELRRRGGLMVKRGGHPATPGWRTEPLGV